MATPRPTHTKSGQELAPTPAFEDLMLDPDTDEADEADVTGMVQSEETGEWYDPAVEDPAEAIGSL